MLAVHTYCLYMDSIWSLLALEVGWTEVRCLRSEVVGESVLTEVNVNMTGGGGGGDEDDGGGGGGGGDEDDVGQNCPMDERASLDGQPTRRSEEDQKRRRLYRVRWEEVGVRGGGRTLS